MALFNEHHLPETKYEISECHITIRSIGGVPNGIFDFERVKVFQNVLWLTKRLYAFAQVVSSTISGV